MRFIDLIRAKRDREELSSEQIGWMISSYTRDEIPDYQMSAWLMAAFLNGLSHSELTALTHAMLHSGSVLDLSDIPTAKVDKHSTGGVGDKTSLIIAPLVAAAGIAVPMISGRGLGHTGGTLDKLESIPGFNVQLTEAQIRTQLKTIGVAMGGQTADIAPADKRIYALRDVTATVESPELICASIMSKKLAEGLDALVLDVKTGSGAFMKQQNDARHLAELMVATGERMGKKVIALITDMDQPLGRTVGNALEVRECVDVLRGGGPQELSELSFLLSAWMLLLGGVSDSLASAQQRITQLIDSGEAYRKFLDLVSAQGGDVDAIEHPDGLPRAAHTKPLAATASGFVENIACEQIGVASLVLGGGREHKEDVIDPAVGLVLHKKVGDAVTAGEALCEIHYNSDARLHEVEDLIRNAYRIGASAPQPRPLVLDVVATAGVLTS